MPKRKSKPKPFMITVSFPLPAIPRMNKTQRRNLVAIVERFLAELRTTI